MELKDFIVQALTDIHGAMDEVKEKTNKGYIIKNTDPGRGTTPKGGIISFDIAVVSEKQKAVKSGVQAGISVFGGSVGGELKNIDQNLSRIKFDLALREN